ncbi:unnamed protein product [Acanthoscelides obtectus]|uniref:beta-glucosidase n=1 Tax=Acanthoscelides obtectus TaxID=200917 RepID=A0A9P0VT81_ACAOB|nr:unnamed protein product [Acanthoscelides obtectus]CAK1656623.1 hypothetical protein AOBTE_LOCUS19837 [Acanthoscelides obtectus]
MVWAPGMRKLLNWLKNTYNNPEIVITENGLSDNTGTLEDDHRINYYRDYLSNCLDAIYIDNVNLTGYTAWSILDDWEWSTGYHSLIGMYKVDFNDLTGLGFLGSLLHTSPKSPRTAAWQKILENVYIKQK